MKFPLKFSDTQNKNLEQEILVVTNEPRSDFILTAQLELDLAKSRENLMKNKKDAVVELKKMIQKYPHVNTFYNFLALAYQNQGKHEEEYELIKKTIKKFPNYFFARINLLSHYVSTQNVEELDKLLENVDSIQDYAPQKESFHISEVSSFYSAFLDYLALKLENKRIKEIWKFLEMLSQQYEELEEKMPIIKHKFSLLLRFSHIEETQRRIASIIKVKAISTSSIKPILNAEMLSLYHSEILDLCLEDFYDMTQDMIDEFAELPREMFIQDLEAILIYIQTRKKYLYSDEDEDIDMPYNTVFHVLNFISFLDSKESIPLVLDLFRQDEEFLEFWLGDEVDYSYLVWLLYKFFENDFSSIANFVKEESNKNTIRMGMMSIPAQVALHHPERRQEAIDLYKDLIQFFIENKDNEKILDSHVIAHLGDLVTNIQGKELRQELIELDKAGLINSFIYPIEDMLRELDTPFYSIFQNRKVNLTISLLEAYNLIFNHQPFTYPRTEKEAKKSKEKSKVILEEVQENLEFFKVDEVMKSRLQMEKLAETKTISTSNQYKEDNYKKEASMFDSYIKNKASYQRNDKVTVKYKNGKIIENTKYKKVEKDVKEGKCEVI